MERDSNPRNLAVRHVSNVVVSASHPPIRTMEGALAQLPRNSGGATGIRTLETLPSTHFPGVRLRPLGHRSASCRRLETASGMFAMQGWRRARDSNPGWASTHSRFRVERLRPLSQLSVSTLAEKVGFEPTDSLRRLRFSRPLPSTTQPLFPGQELVTSSKRSGAAGED